MVICLLHAFVVIAMIGNVSTQFPSRYIDMFSLGYMSALFLNYIIQLILLQNLAAFRPIRRSCVFMKIELRHSVSRNIFPLFSTTKEISSMLFHTFYAGEPRNPILCELLELRLQHRPLERDIVYGADPHENLVRCAGRYSIHKTTTDGTEVVRHRVSTRNSFVHREFSDFAFAPSPLHGCVLDDEIGRKH